jgi:hypothetical protein
MALSHFLSVVGEIFIIKINIDLIFQENIRREERLANEGQKREVYNVWSPI